MMDTYRFIMILKRSVESMFQDQMNMLPIFMYVPKDFFSLVSIKKITKSTFVLTDLQKC